MISTENFQFEDSYTSKKEFLSHFSDYATNTGFEYFVRKSSKKRLVVHCKKRPLTNCKFSVTLTSRSNLNFWKISSSCFEHSAECSNIQNCNSNCRATFLLSKLDAKLRSDSSTSIESLKKYCEEEHLIQPNYHQVWESKKLFLKNHSNESEDIQKSPAFGLRLNATLPRTNFMFEKNNNGVFERLFMILPSSIEEFSASNKIIFLDGTFLTSVHKGILLAATFLDPNNKIVVLGIAIVAIENVANWMWFLENLLSSVPEINENDSAFVSDRQKGLLDAISTLFSTRKNIFCARHIFTNMASKFSMTQMKGLFWEIVDAFSFQHYSEVLERIRRINNSAANYLQSINPAFYSKHAINFPRYGNRTSNVAESFNALIRDYKDKSYLELIRFIVIDTFQKKQIKARPNSFKGDFTAHSMKVLNDNISEGSRMTLKLQSNDSNIAEIADSFFPGRTFIVNLQERTYTCLKYQDLLIPCRHVCHFLFKLNRRPIEFIGALYSKVNYNNGHSEPIPVIDFNDLEKDNTLLPPNFEKRIGRPKKKRMPSRGECQANEASVAKRQRKCKKCQQLGHNSRTCSINAN